MKKLIAMLLAIALLMTFAGCAGGDTDPTQKETTPNQTEATEPTQPEPTEPPVVDQLRQQLEAEGKSFAVAYLGYMTFEYETVWDYIDSLGDAVLQKLPFLAQIPETNMIAKDSDGEVYCFIPTNPEAVVEILTDEEKSLFKGSSAEPFLLICNSLFYTDVYVTFNDLSNGEEADIWWYPKLDQDMFVEPLRYANGTTGALDISPYNEMLLAYYKDRLENAAGTIPTKAELENTTWYWDGYTEGGNYFEYRVTFHEDTADVQWNPGYGETTEYKGAAWSLEGDDVGVLTIDFAEFAGVRKYNLLVDWELYMMYIAVDATGEPITWNMEPQSRFMIFSQPGAQPMELVGTWERIYTEVEGYLQESAAGQTTIKITGTTENDLRLAYSDKEFPDSNYSDKALFINPDGDTMGFGDVAWVAEIDHVGNFGQTYALAIVDDLLILRNFFTVDGAPGVSYETFQRVD